MEEHRSQKGFRQLAEPAGGILDPVLRKRAGMTIGLLQSWGDIVGGDLGDRSRPLKLLWPRRSHEDDPFRPATLIVAATGFTAMRIQHETSEIISRVNAFLGFPAVARVKIEQRHVEPLTVRRKVLPALDSATTNRISRSVESIEDGDLREALQRLGQNVYAEHLNRRT